jgi:hypothetical protein
VISLSSHDTPLLSLSLYSHQPPSCVPSIPILMRSKPPYPQSFLCPLSYHLNPTPLSPPHYTLFSFQVPSFPPINPQDASSPKFRAPLSSLHPSRNNPNTAPSQTQTTHKNGPRLRNMQPTCPGTLRVREQRTRYGSSAGRAEDDGFCVY